MCEMMKIFAAVAILFVGVTKSQHLNESFTNSSGQISTSTESSNEDDVKKIPVTSSADVLYGDSDAEQLGELSVIDILFRKRRNLNIQSGSTEVTQTTEKSDYSPVLVEEIEFSYDDIIGDDDDSMTNITSTTEESKPFTKEANKNGPALKTYLTPPFDDNAKANNSNKFNVQ